MKASIISSLVLALLLGGCGYSHRFFNAAIACICQCWMENYLGSLLDPCSTQFWKPHVITNVESEASDLRHIEATDIVTGRDAFFIG